MAIVNRHQAAEDRDAPSAVRSPGLQWLHYLGVSETLGRQGSPQSNQLPSATAWLSRKSQHFLGLGAKANDLESPSPNQEGNRSESPVVKNVNPAARQSQEASGKDPEQPLLWSISNVQQADQSPSESTTQSTDAIGSSAQGLPETSANEGSFGVPQTVFAPGKETESESGLKAAEQRRQLQFKSLSGVNRGPVRGVRNPRPSFHSKSLPSSTHASERDASSNEERGFMRRAYANPRSELQDHGSVSLAYSEHDADHSSDTEVTDGGGELGSANGTCPDIILDTSRHSQMDGTSGGEQTVPSSEITATQYQHLGPASDPANESNQAVSSELKRKSMEGIDEDRKRSSQEAVQQSQGPVFVPIVMSMADNDQALLLEQRYSMHMVSHYLLDLHLLQVGPSS